MSIDYASYLPKTLTPTFTVKVPYSVARPDRLITDLRPDRLITVSVSPALIRQVQQSNLTAIRWRNSLLAKLRANSSGSGWATLLDRDSTFLFLLESSTNPSGLYSEIRNLVLSTLPLEIANQVHYSVRDDEAVGLASWARKIEAVIEVARAVIGRTGVASPDEGSVDTLFSSLRL
jgi:hypothetical protein